MTGTHLRQNVILPPRNVFENYLNLIPFQPLLCVFSGLENYEFSKTFVCISMCRKVFLLSVEKRHRKVKVLVAFLRAGVAA